MRSNDAELPEMIDAAAIEHWDEEADVLVIGYGMAGACAALEALRAGADVLIVERYSGFGGSTASAGGGMSVSRFSKRSTSGSLPAAAATRSMLKPGMPSRRRTLIG